jgi:hypothetical protein
MKPPAILFLLALLMFSAVGTVAAAGNYTSTFADTDVVRINQSLIHDPTSDQARPWDLWVLSGIIGIALVLLALMKPRSYRMDYEIGIIVSVLAWPFLMYWTWGALTSIDRVIGAAMTTGAGGETIMITQHILYTFPILGYVGVAGIAAAVLISILLIAQFKEFKETEGKQGENS